MVSVDDANHDVLQVDTSKDPPDLADVNMPKGAGKKSQAHTKGITEIIN